MPSGNPHPSRSLKGSHQPHGYTTAFTHPASSFLFTHPGRWQGEGGGTLPSSSYLGSEHVYQAIGGSVEREAPDQVDDEHTVGQQRSEIHHLRHQRAQSASWPSFAQDRPAIPLKLHAVLGIQAADSWERHRRFWVWAGKRGAGDAAACVCNCQEISGFSREEKSRNRGLCPPSSFQPDCVPERVRAAHKHTSIIETLKSCREKNQCKKKLWAHRKRQPAECACEALPSF